MNSIAMMIATVTLGVDYGYQPLADGQMEYIIQLEPQTVKAMLAGEAVFSEIAPEVKGVRRFRIVVGTDKLPRVKRPAAVVNPPKKKDPVVEFPKKPMVTQPVERPVVPKEKTFTPPTPVIPPLGTEIPLPKEKEAPLDPDRYGDNNKNTNTQENQVTNEPSRFPTPKTRIPPIQTATHTHRTDDIEPHTESSALNKPVINEDDPAAQAPKPVEKEAPKSWGLLILALIGLFVSVGANLYQGWIGLGLRGKYHDMVDQLYAAKKKLQA